MISDISIVTIVKFSTALLGVAFNMYIATVMSNDSVSLLGFLLSSAQILSVLSTMGAPKIINTLGLNITKTNEDVNSILYLVTICSFSIPLLFMPVIYLSKEINTSVWLIGSFLINVSLYRGFVGANRLISGPIHSSIIEMIAIRITPIISIVYLATEKTEISAVISSLLIGYAIYWILTINRMPVYFKKIYKDIKYIKYGLVNILSMVSKEIDSILAYIFYSADIAFLVFFGKRVYGLMSIFNESARWVIEPLLSNKYTSLEAKTSFKYSRNIVIRNTLLTTLFIIVIGYSFHILGITNKIDTPIIDDLVRKLTLNDLSILVLSGYFISRQFENLFGPIESYLQMRGELKQLSIILLSVIIVKLFSVVIPYEQVALLLLIFSKSLILVVYKSSRFV